MSTLTMMNHNNIPASLRFSNGIPPTTTFTALRNSSAPSPSPSSSDPKPIAATSATGVGSKRGLLARTNKASAFARRISTELALRDEKPRCKQMLPDDFVPTPYTVVCGRGRKCTTAVGNRRLQVIATMFIPKYSQCRRKEDKTEIVSQILAMVKSACSDERQAFVKYHDGRWWEVETLIAREKIGAVLRDCLHDKYRSSTKSKLERRRLQKLKDREDDADGIDSENDDDEDIQRCNISRSSSLSSSIFHMDNVPSMSVSSSSMHSSNHQQHVNSTNNDIMLMNFRNMDNMKQRVSTTSFMMFDNGNSHHRNINSIENIFNC